MQSVDLVIADIDWLITVDPGRRIIRDAAIAVDGGKIVAVGKSAEIAAELYRQADRSTAATPWRRRASSTATCIRRSSSRAGSPTRPTRSRSCSTACIPTRPRSTPRTCGVSATLAAAELLKHGVTCFVDPGNYHPEASVEGVMSTGIRMIVSRSSFDLTKSVLGILPERMIETTATGAGARRGGAGEIRQDRQSAARRQRLVPRPQQCVRRTDRRPRQARQANTARCCRPTPASAIRPTIPASPAPAWPRSSGSKQLGVHRRAHADRAFRLARARGGGDPGASASRRWSARRRRACTTATAISSFGKLPELIALGVNVAIGSDHASSGIVDMSQEMRLACCCYKETRHQSARHAAGDRRSRWRPSTAPRRR